MKILMVNDYRCKIAGTEIYLDHIVKALQKRKHEVIIFASNITLEQYVSSNYNKNLKKYLIRFFNFKYYLEFKKLIKEFKPDIIHIHNIYNEITPSILFNLKDIPIVMTIHDSRIISPVSLQTERTGKYCKNKICEGCINCVGLKGSIYEFMKKKIYRKLFKRIDLFISPSNYLRTILINKNYSPVMRLYNGISLLKYSPINDNNNLLYAGRLTQEKGIDVLINAINKIKFFIPNIQLTILGDGNYKKEIIERIKKLKLKKYVNFLGLINNNYLYKYYRNTTLVIIPSIAPDNLPTTGLEALSVGRPVIGSGIGGIPEIVKNNFTGLIIEPNNSESLAKAIERLFKNKNKLNIMSKNARKYAEDNFDIKNHILELEKIYRNIINNNNFYKNKI